MGSLALRPGDSLTTLEDGFVNRLQNGKFPPHPAIQATGPGLLPRRDFHPLFMPAFAGRTLHGTDVTRDTVIVTIPPEAAFDRYLRSQNEKDRKKYPGKYDLDQLDSGSLKELLLGLQVVLNLSLASEQQVPEHRDHPPFHVDYIKSTEANAIAFRHDGYSFIGITILLIEVAAQLCARLCNSLDLLHALGLEPTQEVSEALGSVLLEILLFFVVSHEYTHIVHGHPLSEVTESGLIHEFSIGSRTGSFDDQILEADADSYAMSSLFRRGPL
jgi:hypothetical protein